MNRKKWICLSILVLSFIISLLSIILGDKRYNRVSFIYYHELEERQVVENRYVLLPKDKEERAKVIVDELFLGPHSVFNKKIVDFGFTYNHMNLNGKILYLDLPLELINYVNNNDIVLEEITELMELNLFRNISGIKEIIITLNGEFIGFGPSKEKLPQSP